MGWSAATMMESQCPRSWFEGSSISDYIYIYICCGLRWLWSDSFYIYIYRADEVCRSSNSKFGTIKLANAGLVLVAFGIKVSIVETKLSKCKPIVSKGKSKFPNVQGGFRYDDEEGNKGFVYIYWRAKDLQGRL